MTGLQATLAQVTANRAAARRAGKRLPRRLRRPPKLLYPSGIEVTYVRLLLDLMRALRADVWAVVVPELARIKAAHDTDRGIRQDGMADDIKALIAMLAQRFGRRVARLRALITETSRKVSDFHARQIERLMRTVLGVDVWHPEPWLPDELKLWTDTNDGKAKALGEQTIARVEKAVVDGVRKGATVEAIEAELAAQMAIAERRGKNTARNQVSELNGRLNGLRQQAMGLSYYFWRGWLDHKERPAHVAREGTRYSWAHPPTGGDHPGCEPNCRCWPEPDMTPLAAALAF